jgi:RNA polymerase-associated protein LEO1
MSDSEEQIDIPDEGEDDLFGDGGEDDGVAQSDNERVLSDRELASEQDVDERDDRDDVDMDEMQEKQKIIMNVQMYRHQAPKTKDGTVSLLSGITSRPVCHLTTD